MQTQFAKKPEWSENQRKVLEAKPNLIISGCAGSGKTLLACHIAMEHSKDAKVGILVFTKALCAFITAYIDGFGINNISVLYKHQGWSRNFPKFDIILVDEFQDFSANDIDAVVSSAQEGVYLFGDEEQKIYSENFQKEPTLSIDEIIAKTKFEHLKLTDNFRISEENKNLIEQLYNANSLKYSRFSTGIKPKIIRFENVEHEVNWLKEFLLSNTEFKNIGILMKHNDGFIGGYYQNKQFLKTKIYGIFELQNFFKDNGINSGYKDNFTQNLNFSEDININIMTYHSSKGLQFDCVILPFSNCVNNFIHAGNFYSTTSKNLPYVGLTRAANQIIITYSGFIAEEYEVNLWFFTFEGRIIKWDNSHSSRQEKEEFRKIISTWFKYDSEEYKKYINEYVDTEDVSDCKFIKL